MDFDDFIGDLFDDDDTAYLDRLDDEFGIYDILRDHGYEPHEFRDIIRDLDYGDIDPLHDRPHTSYDLDDLLHWIHDGKIEDMAYIWYDDDTGEWHYAVDYELRGSGS